MSINLEQALAKLPAKTPSADMFGMIHCAIAREKKIRSLKRRAAAFGVGLTVLASFMAAFWNVLWQELAGSSFMLYLQTFLTEHDALSFWKEAALSLLESMPIINLLAWSLLVFFALGLISEILVLVKSRPHNHHLQKHHTFLT
ncbi:MAG: hypothetical protein PHC70_04005 [Patescibacteria group bacterium]|nr:hypothetical protein [Patescibacteria group bacterium]